MILAELQALEMRLARRWQDMCPTIRAWLTLRQNRRIHRVDMGRAAIQPGAEAGVIETGRINHVRNTNNGSPGTARACHR